MIKSKVQSRQRRSVKTRAIIAKTNVARLVVHRTNQHVYASVIEPDEKGHHRTIASASTLESELKKKLMKSKKSERAHTIGKIVIERAIKNGVSELAFDRSGFKYHGCIKAIAEGAREAGAKF